MCSFFEDYSHIYINPIITAPLRLNKIEASLLHDNFKVFKNKYSLLLLN